MDKLCIVAHTLCHTNSIPNKNILWLNGGKTTYKQGIFIESGGKLYPLWVERDSRPAALGHWVLGIGMFFPMPNNCIPLYFG